MRSSWEISPPLLIERRTLPSITTCSTRTGSAGHRYCACIQVKWGGIHVFYLSLLVFSIYFMPEGGRTSSPSLDSTDGRVDTPPLAHFGHVESPPPVSDSHLGDNLSFPMDMELCSPSGMDGVSAHVSSDRNVSVPPFSNMNASSVAGTHYYANAPFPRPPMPPLFHLPPPPIGGCVTQSHPLPSLPPPPFSDGALPYPFITPPFPPPPFMPPATTPPTMGMTLLMGQSASGPVAGTSSSSSTSRPTNCRFLSNETITKWISTGEAARLEHGKNNFGGGGGSGGNLGPKSALRKDPNFRGSSGNR